MNKFTDFVYHRMKTCKSAQYALSAYDPVIRSLITLPSIHNHRDMGFKVPNEATKFRFHQNNTMLTQQSYNLIMVILKTGSTMAGVFIV